MRSTMRRRKALLAATCLALTIGLASEASAADGPCTAAARGGMPEGTGHNHRDISQHRLGCRMKQVAFLSLQRELGARPNVVLGEMDVKADRAAVLVTYPEAGFLLFDVSNPANPKFLSWYRSAQCDTTDGPNCGSFVDVSRDGKTVYLSKQEKEPVPPVPDVGPITGGALGIPLPYDAVEVVDISNPASPRKLQDYSVLSVQGVHTVRSHVVPAGPPGAGRTPGEYVFSLANGVGVNIAAVDRSSGQPELVDVGTIPTDLTFTAFVHDTFIQNDPIDGRTYLYIAAGLYPGFVIYDVTDPYDAVYKAEWDLTPECRWDWYGHTIDVTHRGSKRYVTMPAELFLIFEQPEEDQAKGCGKQTGNGDKVGPLWIVDASDFSKLGNGPDDGQSGEQYDQELKQKSQAALVATWTNPANRVAGDLRFSPHNQQIVGDRIYLSHYHGGVYVLDASAAFAGRKERPGELAFTVPHDPATRPLYEPVSSRDTAVQEFGARSSIWDAFFYKGHVLAADMGGGLYSLQEGDFRAARPRLRLALSYRKRRLSRRRTCARSAVRARVTGRDRRQVRRADFYVGRRRVARDRKAPFRTRIKRSRLRRGQVNRLRARVRLGDGRRATLTRRLRVCR